MEGLGRGFAGTVLAPAPDIIGDQMERDKLNAAAAPKRETPKFDYKEYVGPTGSLAMKAQRNFFSQDNSEVEKIMEAHENGDPNASIMLSEYVARVGSVAKDYEALGNNLNAIQAKIQEDGYDWQANTENFGRLNKFILDIDENNPATFDEDGNLAFVTRDGQVIPRAALDDMFYMTEKNLVNAKDWDAATRSLKAAENSWEVTSTDRDGGGIGEDIITSRSGKAIDKKKVRRHLALHMSPDIDASMLNPDGTFIEGMKYRINDYGANGVARYVGGDVAPYELRGKEIDGKDLNVVLNRGFDIIESQIGTSSSQSTRYQGGSGGGGGGYGDAGFAKPRLTKDNTVIKEGGEPWVTNSKPVRFGQTRGVTDQGTGQQIMERFIISDVVYPSKSGDRYFTVAEVVDIPKSEIDAITGGSGAAYDEDVRVIIDKYRDKPQYYKSRVQLTPKEANEYQARINVTDYKSHLDRNRKIAEGLQSSLD